MRILCLLNYGSAEALDNHLTVVQRDHEHISQLEEKRIRDDAAREEAKRKEKALIEEKIRQEGIKAEEEVLSAPALFKYFFYLNILYVLLAFIISKILLFLFLLRQIVNLISN